MIRRVLAVALLSVTGLVFGGAAAFASGGDFTELCVDTTTGSSMTGVRSVAASTSLASTGAGMDIGMWVLVGIATLAVGLTLAMVGVGPRRAADNTPAA